MSNGIYNATGMTDELFATLDAIADHMQCNRGQSPTLKEIGALLSPNVSVASVHFRIKALEKFGYVSRELTASRKIRLTDKAIETVKMEK